MSHYFLKGCAAACAYVFAAQGAWAELSAQDVWTEWRNYLSSVGYQVSGSESMAGGTLTVSDFNLSMQIPEDAGSFSVGIPQIAFTENGDGTVGVTLPGTIPLRVDTVDGNDQVSVEVGVSQNGSSMVVSGSPTDMTYNYTAAGMSIDLASITVNGQPTPPDMGRFTVGLDNITSSTRLKVGDMRDYSQRVNADALSYDMAFNDPGSGDMGTFKGTLQGIGFTGSGAIPLQIDTSDFQKMMDAGFAFRGGFTYASSSTEMAAKGDGEEFSYSGTSQGGGVEVAMDASRIAYDVSQKMPAVNVISNQLPFPVSIQLSELGFALDMPVAKSDALQPFAFGLTLADFTVPEVLWGIFDPAGIMPREPATVRLDLTGEAKVLHDLMDPETAVMLEQTGMPPGELHALKVNNLEVSAVGASLTGNGDFTFDNSDLATFGGVPRPQGVANLVLVGADALIDNLIKMGLVSDQDAMGARMMMGMLAVPGDAPDTRNSTIEINEQGQVLANGQRIK